jgi:hypothetical protein
MTIMGMRPGQVRCRPIADEDHEAVINCLVRGFPSRPREYWAEALARLAKRPAIDDYPRYGYLLESSTGVVGVIMQIFARYCRNGNEAIRCNLSSWCVDFQYRGYALLLVAAAVKRKEVTYTNISPAVQTQRGIEAQGFRRFCNGQIGFFAALSAPRFGVRVVDFDDATPEAALLPEDERRILRDHVAYGCDALICVENGEAHPFVFRRRRVLRDMAACAQLIYCRDMSEMTRYAGPIGRRMLFRGTLLFVADSNGPVKGLIGRYFADRGPKYFKGDAPPELGDLSFTELVILGP